MMRLRICSLGLMVGLWLLPIPGRAQSDGVLVGDDASLLAGAVTAIVNDGSALYYNPAGLQLVDRNTVDLAITAYSLRLYRIPDALVSTSGVSADANVTEVVIIPAAVSYVRTTKSGLRIGFGVFATSLADYSQRANLTFADAATGFDWEWLIQLSNEISVYHGIAGLGWSTRSRRLHFGATLDLSYVGFSQSSQVGGGLIANQDTGEAVLAASASSSLSLTGLGLRLGFGLLWNPTPAVSFGAAFQTASYLVFDDVSLQSVETAELRRVHRRLLRLHCRAQAQQDTIARRERRSSQHHVRVDIFDSLRDRVGDVRWRRGHRRPLNNRSRCASAGTAQSGGS
ncbi:MAG: hypothetical protein WBM47_01700, partial [Polyangiales bacterium]